MKKIYFRADASGDIGYGHFIRSLSLADMLKDYFDCTFFTQTPTTYQKNEIVKVCNLISLPASEVKYSLFLDLLKGDEIVVLDNYFYDFGYQQEIKSKGCKLVYIDDRKGQHYCADMVINHVIGIQSKDVITTETTKLLLGSDYALLRRSFVDAMQQQNNYNYQSNQILIAMGGTDYFDMTGKIVRFLIEKTDYKINVLIGDRYKYIEQFDTMPVHVYKNLSEDQLRNLIEIQKFVISTPSTFAYEVCAIGCPLIIGSFCDNHIAVEHALSEYHLATSCGQFNELTREKLINSISHVLQNYHKQISQQRHAFDGKQMERFQQAFKELI